ncbi:MAG: D-alanine--D-alanine ligase [Candidatus Pacebacteria bacterium]|nr:D-alanine--D-alanine ligase [Candidatus Paceibacterota bacterium]
MKNVIIIFGGKSGEHEVSVNSAKAIEQNIDQSKFSTAVIGISPNGSWVYGEDIASLTEDGKVRENNSGTLPNEHVVDKLTNANIVFPIIHGTNGEDGTLQGLLDLANIPYVGSGVLGSAVCMDKVIQKQLCSTAGIPQTDYTFFNKTDWKNSHENILEIINDQLSYPLFVKPANLGSSVGISKVSKKDDLQSAIEEALQFDNKIIVEQGVVNILEVEVSVMGNDEPQSSVCGSISPNSEFYDYETKYLTDDIKAQIPAQIIESDSQAIRDLAIESYKVLNCEGLARIDFFYDLETAQIMLNEVNTLPGFTKTSMYPKLWAESGLSYQDLITKLLAYAEKSWQAKQALKYTY